MPSKQPKCHEETRRVPGVGPKKVALFWKELNILTLADLEAAAKAGKIRTLPGMGEKSEISILAGITSLAQSSGRMTLLKAGEINRHYRATYGLHRLALHASLLAFEHPVTGARVVVDAPTPDDLGAALDALGLPRGADAAPRACSPEASA